MPTEVVGWFAVVVDILACSTGNQLWICSIAAPSSIPQRDVPLFQCLPITIGFGRPPAGKHADGMESYFRSRLASTLHAVRFRIFCACLDFCVPPLALSHGGDRWFSAPLVLLLVMLFSTRYFSGPRAFRPSGSVLFLASGTRGWPWQ